MTGSVADSVDTVLVQAASGDYPVFVGTGALDRITDYLEAHAPAHSYAIVSDHHVAPLHGARVLDACRSAGLRAGLYTFPAGEASKTRKSWSILTDELLDEGCGRDSCVVAVGGGVTGDLAGFVAATFLRGVSLVQVPTSYLAMIDASVGGKTGVDVRAGKNLVGAFHAPRCVVADPDVLGTLPDEERGPGLVEAFKHGAILDEAYFDSLRADTAALLAADGTAAIRAVRRSVEIKADVVSRDEREGGLRQILNFGHTLGHALEAASGFALGHGAAVAEGMMLEADIGERLGVTEQGTRERLGEALGGLGLDTSAIQALDAQTVVGYLAADKKARAGRPRFVLLQGLGAVDGDGGWSREVPEDLVADVLAERVSGSQKPVGR